MEKPIFDPVVPYIGPIYGGNFVPGKTVIIQGTSPGAAYRFNINLRCVSENNPQDDVALHFGVHILDGLSVLNSLENGTWGEELRVANLPIQRAQKFDIIIRCEADKFMIALNGQHFAEFRHRIPYERITHLAIDGDVTIIQISYELNDATSTIPLPAYGEEEGGKSVGFTQPTGYVVVPSHQPYSINAPVYNLSPYQPNSLTTPHGGPGYTYKAGMQAMHPNHGVLIADPNQRPRNSFVENGHLTFIIFVTLAFIICMIFMTVLNSRRR